MKKLNSPKSVGFEFVQKGKYPEFIKKHSFFKQTATGSADNKIFPSLGLPNTVQDVCFVNNDMGNYARSALADISHYVNSVTYSLPAETQLLIRGLIDSFRPSYDGSVSTSTDGKIELRLSKDIVVNDKVVYKKGKSIFKIYAALEPLCKGEYKLPSLDQIPSVKAFNSCNVPAEGMKIFFSSTGEEGYWDLATISMRGISSCQAWSAAQSKALISSMSSRYVGVIYIGTGEPYNEYGSRMIRRALVRLVIHKTTKERVIYVDNIYPGGDSTAAHLFKKFIAEKTGLKVFAVNLSSDLKERVNYFVPNEATWTNHPLGPGEDFYFDSPITLTRNKYYPPANILEINAIDQIIQDNLKRFALKWFEGKKNIRDWNVFFSHLTYSPINFIYNACATHARHMSQAEFNRICLRHVIVHFKELYETRIVKNVFYGYEKNQAWIEINPAFKKEMLRLLLEEYKKSM